MEGENGGDEAKVDHCESLGEQCGCFKCVSLPREYNQKKISRQNVECGTVITATEPAT